MDKVKVNEAKKFLNRTKPLMNGSGLLVGTEENFLEYPGLENVRPHEFINSDEDKYDYIMSIFPNKIGSKWTGILADLLKAVKPGGFLLMYIPHKFYYPFDEACIPHDIIVDLKQVHQYLFELQDFQTYGYEGAYETQDHQNVEYAFQIVIRKASNAFNRKRLDDDPGSLVSLED
jgi:hypothetical protein